MSPPHEIYTVTGGCASEKICQKMQNDDESNSHFDSHKLNRRRGLFTYNLDSYPPRSDMPPSRGLASTLLFSHYPIHPTQYPRVALSGVLWAQDRRSTLDPHRSYILRDRALNRLRAPFRVLAREIPRQSKVYPCTQ